MVKITEKQALAMMWLNNVKILDSNKDKEKPCGKLGYCPYGNTVETFELREKRNPKISCTLFGHDCPVFYCAEDVSEDSKQELYDKDMEGKK